MPDIIAIYETGRQIKVTTALTELRGALIEAARVSIDSGELDTADKLLEIEETVRELVEKHLEAAKEAHEKAKSSME